MNGSVWRKWLWGGLIFLLLISVAWTAAHWSGDDADKLPDVEEFSLKFNYQIMRESRGSVGGSWLRTLNPRMKDVQGDLVWSTAEQKGVMRFINLPKPDKGFRYHLWIHDSRSKDGQPVSGAILNAGSGKQELFVSIEAQAKVAEPFKFVLTMEDAADKQQPEQILLMVQP